jgi:trimeric autotransporter adhesin
LKKKLSTIFCHSFVLFFKRTYIYRLKSSFQKQILMKKKFILLPLVGALLWITLPGYIAGPATSGLDASGATGSTTYCGSAGCHNPGPTSTTNVTIQVYSAPGTTVTSYTPASTYTVVITGVNTSATLNLPKFGFQLAAVKSAGAGTGSAVNAGSFSAPPAGTHLATASGINIFEHNPTSLAPLSGTGGFGTVYRDSIIWTAPSTGTGTVVFYGVVNAVNGDGAQNSFDKWNNTTFTLTESSSTVAAISGPSWVCTGATITLSDATAGGAWSSSATSVATVSTAGVVTGVSAGTTTISYTVSGSSAVSVVTVYQAPVAITGPSSVCTGATITLSDPSTGGLTTGWISGNAAIATVGSGTGVVGGVAAGTANITYGIVYTFSAACYTSHSVTVNSATPPAVLGSTTVCLGQTITLSDATSGGTWSSSNTAKASVSSAGIVTGVSAGTTVISYTTTNSCGTGSATTTVTISTSGACNNGVNTVTGNTDNLSVYPNPNNGSFALNLATDMSEPATITITNILGLKVQEFHCYTNMVVDLKLSQPAGMYFITAATERNRYTTKVLVQ